jgi:hypothetical protein
MPGDKNHCLLKMNSSEEDVFSSAVGKKQIREQILPVKTSFMKDNNKN